MIYFARVSLQFLMFECRFTEISQSGPSLIEHSYKADADLSPAGWEYAEKLKEFVLERRAKSLEQRGHSAKERKLVVLFSTTVLRYAVLTTSTFHSTRFGLLPIGAQRTLHGPSSPVPKRRVSRRVCLLHFLPQRPQAQEGK
jgi:6-phosphofructo-2-kinase/fructose-2,6-biphosphatase 4